MKCGDFIFLPRFNVTIAASVQTGAMTDCFYINGAVPPEGNRTLTKPILRTVSGKNHVFAVADSVSVNEGISTPSHTLCSLLKKYQTKLSDANVEQLDYIMKDVATDLNGEISSISSASSYGNFASSFSLLTVNGGVATVTTAGNTSAYLMRDGELTSLSAPVAASVLPIGNKPSGDIVEPYLSDSYEITKNDVFLICSDGLTSTLSDERISYILSLDLSDERIVTRLISEALAHGCSDNITVMLVRNGGQPYSSKKKTKGFLSLIVPVVILAVLLAFMVSGIRSCSKKPEISHEGANLTEPTQTPKPTEFMSSEATPAPTDDFVLRTPENE